MPSFGMPSYIDLLSWCAEFTLSHSTEVEQEVVKELQTSARTELVARLRLLRIQRIILAIGMFLPFRGLASEWHGVGAAI
jgi:hypothetical protein